MCECATSEVRDRGGTRRADTAPKDSATRNVAKIMDAASPARRRTAPRGAGGSEAAAAGAFWPALLLPLPSGEKEGVQDTRSRAYRTRLGDARVWPGSAKTRENVKTSWRRADAGTVKGISEPYTVAGLSRVPRRGGGGGVDGNRGTRPTSPQTVPRLAAKTAARPQLVYTVRAAVFVRSEYSNALVGDGVLQPAPRSANLDSAFGGMQLFATEAWRAAPLLLTHSAQLTQPTVRLPQL